MKRVFDIFLIILFLLNAQGFYDFLEGLLKFKYYWILTNTNTSPRLKSKFNLHFYMLTASKEYTCVEDEFEHQSEISQMLKQKLSSNTIYIACVKNQISKDISRIMSILNFKNDVSCSFDYVWCSHLSSCQPAQINYPKNNT